MAKTTSDRVMPPRKAKMTGLTSISANGIKLPCCEHLGFETYTSFHNLACTPLSLMRSALNTNGERMWRNNVQLNQCYGGNIIMLQLGLTRFAGSP